MSFTIENTLVANSIEVSSTQGQAITLILTDSFTGATGPTGVGVTGPTGPSSVSESIQVVNWTTSPFFAPIFTGTITFTKIGNIVVFNQNAFISANSDDLPLLVNTDPLGTQIPVAFRPTLSNVEFFMTTINAGTEDTSPGRFVITTAGYLSFSRVNGTQFANANWGWNQFTGTYLISNT
jgi:hypothetical protein